MRRPSRVSRCSWAQGDLLLRQYHDSEWGVPSWNDRHLFEMLSLEGAQAGLSWLTILRKRAGYRRAFSGFHPRSVAAFDRKKVRALILDPAIVRNRLKIESVVTNASAVLRVAREHGSLAAYLWSFAPKNPSRSPSGRPTQTESSRAMSKDLRRQGFRFVGPTTCYSLMQAVGMVSDHELSCFRRREIERARARASQEGLGKKHGSEQRRPIAPAGPPAHGGTRSSGAPL